MLISHNPNDRFGFNSQILDKKHKEKPHNQFSRTNYEVDNSLTFYGFYVILKAYMIL